MQNSPSPYTASFSKHFFFILVLGSLLVLCFSFVGELYIPSLKRQTLHFVIYIWKREGGGNGEEGWRMWLGKVLDTWQDKWVKRARRATDSFYPLSQQVIKVCSNNVVVFRKNSEYFNTVVVRYNVGPTQSWDVLGLGYRSLDFMLRLSSCDISGYLLWVYQVIFSILHEPTWLAVFFKHRLLIAWGLWKHLVQMRHLR